ncbi:MAG: amidohydrolase family protein, partial [Helicobacter sp.]|nr:amidohydrolase family protein [Helicobacter sp.]
MKLIGASFVLVCDEIFTILEKGGVVFNNHEIISVGKYDELAQKFSQTLQELHFYDDCVLMPSLSNLHLHLEFSQNEGYLEFGDFGNWLNSVLTHRDTLMGEGLKDTIKSEIQQLLRSGVSFVGAISSYGYDLELLANSPLRVLYFNEVIGSNPEMLDSLWKNVLARFEDSKQFTSKKFFPTLAIHSPYSVHPALLKRVTTLAKEESLPLSVHFLESFQER